MVGDQPRVAKSGVGWSKSTMQKTKGTYTVRTRSKNTKQQHHAKIPSRILSKIPRDALHGQAAARPLCTGAGRPALALHGNRRGYLEADPFAKGFGLGKILSWSNFDPE